MGNDDKAIQEMEINFLVEAIYQRYGYDFRHYARASLRRRIRHRMEVSNLNHASELIPKILYDEDFFNLFLQDMSVTVTEMFRDPEFFNTFRKEVIPHLKTYPRIKIWHAGCATGEEVYSMAILLEEEGLLERSQIYATDYNNQSLKTAKEGIYSVKDLHEYEESYQQSGGHSTLSNFYLARYNSGKMQDKLQEHITFSNHNLCVDASFGEMQAVICRNVLIYFDKELQDKVLKLFDDSICSQGFLCLGTKESSDYYSNKHNYTSLSARQKIYRKKDYAQLGVAAR